MLTKEEIKLGNYFIYNNDGLSTRIEWTENDWLKLIEYVINIEDIVPIRINQQQLTNFGFEKSDWQISGYDYWYAGVDEMWSLRKKENSKWQMCIVAGLNKVYCFEPILQYVHQLQNLYHSLTDKQLIYKK